MKNFETQRLKIRKFSLKDVNESYNNFAGDEEISEHLNYRAHINAMETKSLIMSAIKEYDSQMPVWAIEEKMSKKVIGFIRVVNVCQSNNMCECIWSIGEKWHEKGMSQEALKEVLNYLFTKENYEIITTYYYCNCKEHEDTLIQLGMKKDAELRNRRKNSKTGEFENLIIYSIMKDELKM